MVGVSSALRQAGDASEEPVVLDLRHLTAQTMGDADLARDVLGMFFEQSNDVLRSLRDARDPRGRSDAAHRLKGAARAVGAFAVAAHAERVEGLADEADEGAVLAVVAGLHAAVAEARTVIAARLQDRQVGGL
jgi:HPt (histidine-containing phosphotransfer) domain-containing protein